MSRQYGVNPLLFGSIYVGAIPLFSLSIAWLVRNIRRKRSIVLPGLSASFFFISSYLYLLVAGHGLPAWVYGVVILMIVAGVYFTWTKIHTRTAPSPAKCSRPQT